MESEESTPAPPSFSSLCVDFCVDVVNRNGEIFTKILTVVHHFGLQGTVFLGDMIIQVSVGRCREIGTLSKRKCSSWTSLCVPSSIVSSNFLFYIFRKQLFRCGWVKAYQYWVINRKIWVEWDELQSNQLNCNNATVLMTVVNWQKT